MNGPSPRVRVLPSAGELLVSTDLHGNLEDFEALERHFEAARARGLDLYWVLLGDLVHGPNPEAAQREPALYGFADESPTLIDRLHALEARHPQRVVFVLGNHDAGHLGFKRTSKFHPDEVDALERRLSMAQRSRWMDLLERAPLMVLAPCGLVLSHGAPGDALQSRSLLEGPLPPSPADVARFRAVHEVLSSYGQPGPVAAAMLARLSEETGFDLRVVVHGHDRDPAGWFIEGDNQVQPVVFGAPRENKRVLWVDLSKPVSSARALVDTSLRWLHAPEREER